MTEPIRVAVNLTWLAPGRVGGSEEYLVRQLSALPVDGSIAPTIYCQRSLVDAYPDLAEGWPLVPMPLRRDRRATRILAEHTWLAARTRSADLVHHGGGTTPLIGGGPIVLTIHDLQYLRFPEYFGRSRRAYLDRMVPRSVAGADVITVPTSYVAGRVADSFGVDTTQIVVVPHGVPQGRAPSAGEIATVRKSYGLGDRPFVIYPAITHPHKGHLLLVEMLSHLDPDVALVLIGGVGDAEDALQRAIAASPVSHRVFRPGRVPAGDRDALIAGAAVMAFPSEYEGFGAPVIEAMTLATPVVCSRAEAVVEVAGRAAVIVEEATAEAWAAAVERAMVDSARLIELGESRCRTFTPEISGRALAEAYRQALLR